MMTDIVPEVPYCYIDQYGYVKSKSELCDKIMSLDDNIIESLQFNDKSWESTMMYGHLLQSIYDNKSIANYTKHKLIQVSLKSNKQYDLLLTDYNDEKKCIYATLISKNVTNNTTDKDAKDIVQQQQQEQKPKDIVQRKFKAAVIDDSITTCKMLKKLLAQQGIDCDIYTDPSKLLDETQLQELDFIFVDIYMPGITGLDFCHRFKSINSTTKLVATSGDISDTLITEVMQAGFDSFVAKPITSEKVSSIVEKI